MVLLTLTVGATSVNDEPETILVAFADDLATSDWAVRAVVFSASAGSAADRTARLSATKGVARNMATEVSEFNLIALLRSSTGLYTFGSYIVRRFLSIPFASHFRLPYLPLAKSHIPAYRDDLWMRACGIRRV
jgi:hypothetical protein